MTDSALNITQTEIEQKSKVKDLNESLRQILSFRSLYSDFNLVGTTDDSKEFIELRDEICENANTFIQGPFQNSIDLVDKIESYFKIFYEYYDYEEWENCLEDINKTLMEYSGDCKTLIETVTPFMTIFKNREDRLKGKIGPFRMLELKRKITNASKIEVVQDYQNPDDKVAAVAVILLIPAITKFVNYLSVFSSFFLRADTMLKQMPRQGKLAMNKTCQLYYKVMRGYSKDITTHCSQFSACRQDVITDLQSIQKGKDSSKNRLRYQQIRPTSPNKQNESLPLDKPTGSKSSEDISSCLVIFYSKESCQPNRTIFAALAPEKDGYIDSLQEKLSSIGLSMHKTITVEHGKLNPNQAYTVQMYYSASQKSGKQKVSMKISDNILKSAKFTLSQVKIRIKGNCKNTNHKIDLFDDNDKLIWNHSNLEANLEKCSNHCRGNTTFETIECKSGNSKTFLGGIGTVTCSNGQNNVFFKAKLTQIDTFDEISKFLKDKKINICGPMIELKRCTPQTGSYQLSLKHLLLDVPEHEDKHFIVRIRHKNGFLTCKSYDNIQLNSKFVTWEVEDFSHWCLGGSTEKCTHPFQMKTQELQRASQILNIQSPVSPKRSYGPIQRVSKVEESKQHHGHNKKSSISKQIKHNDLSLTQSELSDLPNVPDPSISQSEHPKHYSPFSQTDHQKEPSVDDLPSCQSNPSSSQTLQSSKPNILDSAHSLTVESEQPDVPDPSISQSENLKHCSLFSQTDHQKEPSVDDLPSCQSNPSSSETLQSSKPNILDSSHSQTVKPDQQNVSDPSISQSENPKHCSSFSQTDHQKEPSVEDLPSCKSNPSSSQTLQSPKPNILDSAHSQTVEPDQPNVPDFPLPQSEHQKKSNYEDFLSSQTEQQTESNIHHSQKQSNSHNSISSQQGQQNEKIVHEETGFESLPSQEEPEQQQHSNENDSPFSQKEQPKQSNYHDSPMFEKNKAYDKFGVCCFLILIVSLVVVYLFQENHQLPTEDKGLEVLQKKADQLFIAFDTGLLGISHMRSIAEEMDLEGDFNGLVHSIDIKTMGAKMKQLIRLWFIKKGKETASIGNLIRILELLEIKSVADELKNKNK